MTTYILACLAVAAVVLVVLQPPVDPNALEEGEEPAPRWAPALEAPVQAAERGSGISALVDPDWAAATSASTGIPERALLAYAGAAIAKANSAPSCQLSWNTIAAIGAVESDHGRHDGATVGDDGTVSPAIYGVALDGIVTADIPDSDGGELDGDPKFDRAVGPMQLIPQTWRNWHVDGNGDGIEDPQNLDDAVLATANYLCRAGGKLGNEDGWRQAVLAYNQSDDYVALVATTAVGYADAVAGLGPQETVETASSE